MIRIAGITFAIAPGDLLTQEDGARLATLGRSCPIADDPFAVTLVTSPLEVTSSLPVPGPVALVWRGDRLRLDHQLFQAEVDPAGRRAVLFRRGRSSYPLEVVLRTSLLSRLPLDGGIPLHAAGVVLECGAVAFFGPSGAGKSTLAATSAHPVLSDELVAAVRRPGFHLARSGFWGELGERPGSEEAPLRAVVELAKGASYRIERLSAGDAVRRLAHVTAVPFASSLWRAALVNLRSLVAEVPVLRMTWTPREPPWDRLAADLGDPASQHR